jgi:hypothetical protein
MEKRVKAQSSTLIFLGKNGIMDPNSLSTNTAERATISLSHMKY